MALEVIKRDGLREPFNAKKIRKAITVVAKRAKLPKRRRDEVVEQVAKAAIQLAEGKEQIATSEIREKILSELDRIEPVVSVAWRNYEQKKKKA